MGFVYLLSTVTPDGLIEQFKIGVTKRLVEKRLKELQTGNSGKITILKTYESENYLKVETFMHRKYKKNKTEAKNEWFDLSDDNIITFIDDCKKFDETIKLLKENNPFFK